VTLDRLLARGEAMLQELGLEYYMTGAGLKAEPGFQRIYDRFGDLAGEEALITARASGSTALFEWIVDVRVGRTVAAADERQLVWEQGAVLSVDGQRIPYLRAPIEIANSPDRAHREAVDLARAEQGAAGLNGIRSERFEVERDLVLSLGLGDYVDAVSALSGIDLERLGADAAAFLQRTEDMYRDGLARLVRRRLGVPLDSLVRSDSAWLFRADRFDAAFPRERLLDTAAEQMAELGLDFTVSGRVRFDTEERETKQPRAFCVPVRVPDEVYLVLRPRGGHSDYRTFWHELGHAMHFASVDAGLPFAARWLGDNSVTEGFAMLWDHLTLARGWIGRYTELDGGQAAELIFELAVGELFLARRYAAKLQYELELYRSDFASVASRYTEMLGAATGFRYLPEDYLLDVDPGFYAARYLRAWQLEASLAGYLTRKHDTDWYRNPAAGHDVQALMARGQADPAHVVAEEITGAPLGFDAVVDRLEPIFE
jgi:hypothetical protein